MRTTSRVIKCSICKETGHLATLCPLSWHPRRIAKVIEDFENLENAPNLGGLDNIENEVLIENMEVVQDFGYASDPTDEEILANIEENEPGIQNAPRARWGRNAEVPNHWREYCPTNVVTIGAEHNLYMDVPEFTGENAFNDPNLARGWSTPYACFLKFMTKPMMNAFVVYTNLFTLREGPVDWVNLDFKEFKKFVAIILFMGICKLPTRKDYWYGIEKQAFVTSLMSYQRFSSILRCMHYIDVRDLDDADANRERKKDPFWKVNAFVKK